MKTAQLIPFSPPPSDTPSAYTISLNLSKSRNEISAQFQLLGDTARIRWPKPSAEVTQGHELWKHTCFELFCSHPDSPKYWEYNFSPSRQWAIYAFDGYRQSAPSPATHPPVIEPPQLSDSAFTLQVRFNLEPQLNDKSLIIGVSAVIETIDDQRHYYALKHCGKKPDFHLRESFVLKMD
ncbi:DOMON-like domain-containing protein [Kaarinaea lacus]